MKVLSFLLFLPCLLMNNDLFGQYAESIVSSRPGQAFTPNTPGLGLLQVQTGFNNNSLRVDDSPLEVDVLNYSALIRYGVRERAEFRTSLGFSRINTEALGFSQSTGGFSSFSIGTKVNIFESSERGPNVGIQADFFLPIVKEEFQNESVATTLILVHSQSLTDVISLSSNLGAIWDGNDSGAIGLFVLNFGFSLPANFGTFIEMYGFFDDQDIDFLFDTGLSYLVNNDLMFDISGGYGRNEGSVNQYFIDIGLSWRIQLRGEN